MNEVIIPNPEEFEKKKSKIISDGKENFHVVADFDRTLTKAFVEGQKSPTTIAQIRNGNYLGEDYVEKAHELFDKYHPFEIDPNLTIEEKRKIMKEWWDAHHNLLIDSGLTKEIINMIIAKKTLKFRGGAMEFLESLNEKGIPLVIMSAGVGPMIEGYLEQERRLYPSTHIISNNYIFDEGGEMISVKGEAITSVNKYERVVNIPETEDRKNVFLIGDGFEDLGMVEGFDYNTLIKIAFLNENVEEQMELFKKNFDVVILGDGDFSFINEFLQQIN